MFMIKFHIEILGAYLSTFFRLLKFILVNTLIRLERILST